MSKRKLSFSSSSPSAFQQLYGELLCKMLHELVVKDDGEVMQRISRPFTLRHANPDCAWCISYRGSSDPDEYAYEPSVVIRRRDRHAIPLRTVHKLWKEMAEVEDVLLSDYNHVLGRTGGKWSQPITGTGQYGILGEILNITQNWRQQTKKSLKMTFRLRGLHSCHPCGMNVHDFFYPPRLMTYLGMESDEERNEEWEKSHCTHKAKLVE